MSWKPISKSELVNDGAVSTVWHNRPISNAAEIVQAGRCHVFAWPDRYTEAISEDYEGLRIFTSPYTWRGIPLPIPRSNNNGRLRIHILAKTIPGFYSTKASFGGKVDLHFDEGNNPPFNTPWTNDPREDLVGFTSFGRTIESTSNTFDHIELIIDNPPPESYATLDGEPVPTPILWVRSNIGAEVTIPSPLVLGTNVDDFFGYRRSALELPLAFSDQNEKIPLTGRILQKSRRPVSLFSGSMAMNPYPDFYFVEAETIYEETRDPAKPDEEFFGAFVYPPFPTEVLDLINFRNRRFFDISGNPAEFVERVWEATGLIIKSITIEEQL